MYIAINTSPLNSLHAGRGIGQYTKLLLESLKKYDKENAYIDFDGDIGNHVDVVHYPYFDIYQASLKIASHAKTVVTIHDLIPLKYPDKFPSGIRGKIAWWRQKKTLKKVDAVITDSEASALDIVSFASIPREKITVVPLPVSSIYKRLTPKELKNLTFNKFVLPKRFILYVGDINWNKNIPGLLRAFSRIVKEKEYSDIYLLLVGSAFLKLDLPESEEINKIIVEEQIESRVKKLGFVPDSELVGIYNLSSVYIQPSFDEGFGLTPLQALQCGIPVVSSNKGSLSEVLGTVCEYFDPYSIDEISESVKKVLGYSSLEREKKIEKGLEQASKFTAKKLADQTIRVYKQVITTP